GTGPEHFRKAVRLGGGCRRQSPDQARVVGAMRDAVLDAANELQAKRLLGQTDSSHAHFALSLRKPRCRLGRADQEIFEQMIDEALYINPPLERIEIAVWRSLNDRLEGVKRRGRPEEICARRQYGHKNGKDQYALSHQLITRSPGCRPTPPARRIG